MNGKRNMDNCSLRRKRRTAFAWGGVFLAAVLFLSFVRPAVALETIAHEAILMDAQTGAVLFQKNAHRPMHPASMSKMMLVYMLFERLRDGRLSLDDTFPVSENAWRKGGVKTGSSTMFLEPSSRVRIEDLIRGIVVQSGNDACIVVAEGLAGSETAFAAEMTEKGWEMGLENSRFVNATGWPHPDHKTTARDLAIIAKQTIQDFPDYYHYYSETSFTYNGIRQPNRNPLLFKDMGADGLKTGHTESAGFGLAATAKKGKKRLILVLNGLKSVKARSKESERLLEWGFREFDNYALFQAGETVTEADVWLGDSPFVPLVVKEGITITMPRKARRKMRVSVAYEGPLPAPVSAGDEVATLVIAAPEFETRKIPLYAGADVKGLGLVGRLIAALQMVLWGESG
jgi:serine-type D-Ala-D-Ala carboxypeptidase (penicillin-binding protein 5/6)